MTLTNGITNEQIALEKMVSKMYEKYGRLNLGKSETIESSLYAIALLVLRVGS